eukprot:scaffold15885_cov127-Isochrysis_galbana.AAC.8
MAVAHDVQSRPGVLPSAHRTPTLTSRQRKRWLSCPTLCAARRALSLCSLPNGGMGWAGRDRRAPESEAVARRRQQISKR